MCTRIHELWLFECKSGIYIYCNIIRKKYLKNCKQFHKQHREFLVWPEIPEALSFPKSFCMQPFHHSCSKNSEEKPFKKINWLSISRTFFPLEICARKMILTFLPRTRGQEAQTGWGIQRKDGEWGIQHNWFW